MRPSSQKLSVKEIIAYASPGIAIGYFYLILLVYVPKFYADAIGIPVATIGFLLFFTRLWDAITDPLIGHLSDKTHTKFGRRKPWIVFSTIPFAIGAYFFFVPPTQMTETQAIVWFLVTLTVTILAYSAFLVPYMSMGAELSSSYTERTKLIAARGAFIYIGTILAGFSMLSFSKGASPLDFSAQRNEFFVAAVLFIVLIVFGTLLCIAINREPQLAESQKTKFKLFQNFRVLKENKPFLFFIGFFFVGTTSAATGAALVLFFTEHILETSYGPLIVVFYLVSVILSVPIWVRISNKLDKPVAIKLAILIAAICYSIIFFLGANSLILFCILFFIAAGSSGAVQVSIIPSMLPDIIDFDEWKMRIRREGSYIGITGILIKAGAGVALGIVFLVLGWVGYKSAVPPSESVKLAIRIMFAGYSVIACVIQLLFLSFYPINRTVHENIREEIDDRLAQEKDAR